MNYKKLTFCIFLCIIITINVWCALPKFYRLNYKGPYTEIAPGEVLVCETNGFNGPFASVRRVTDDGDLKSVDSGKRVTVAIASDFQDRERADLAKINLAGLLVGTTLYLWARASKNAKL